MDILYLCNRKKCQDCIGQCKYTKDVRYAQNFELHESKDRNGENFMYATEKDASNSVDIVGGEKQ